jgi:RNA polymerase sigma-70 factor, ECF subfamily
MTVTTRQKTPTAEELILTHQRDVWRFLVALGAKGVEADDLTQETFLALLRDDFDYRGPDETAAWLRRVAKNRFISSIRKRRRAALVENLDDADIEWARFTEHCDGDRRVELLRQCVDLLDERPREALRLRYWKGADRSAMAAALGIAEAGVKSMLERLRQRLRECVERKLGDEE